MTKQQKTEILQDIFKGNGQTIGHISQTDVCNDTGIKIPTLNDYINGRHKPSDETMNIILDSCQKIAKSKYDFTLHVKRSGWDK